MRKVLILPVLLLFTACVFMTPVKGQLNTTDDTFALDYKTFSSKGHPKAEGRDIRVEYNSSWIAKEAKRPYIVQKFESPAGSKGCMLQIRGMGNLNLSSQDYEDMADLIVQMGTGPQEVGTITFVKKTKYEGLPGVMQIIENKGERAGAVLYIKTMSHMFGHKNAIFHLQCMVSSLDKEEINDLFEKSISEFISFGNSVVLYDKYQNKKAKE